MSKPKCLPYTLYDPSKPLPPVYKKRAVKELREIPEQISAHLESFRRWIKSMPHLDCTSDDAFLLAFLRHSKYNHMKAQRRLDNLCTFRTSSSEGQPSWFEATPKKMETWIKWIDMKCWTVLGFTDEGTMVAMMKCQNFKLEQLPLADLQPAFQIWNDLCLVDPRVQIGGLCMILDCSQLRTEDIKKMFDPKFSKLGTKYFQDCLPFRIKKLIYYNTPKIFEAMFKLYTEWLNERIKSRIMLLDSDISPAFDEITGLKELLPASYGGDNKLSFEEICDAQANVLKSVEDVGGTFAISVDESKRPKEQKSTFGVYKDLSLDVMGKSGNYIKLNQDEI